MSATELSLRLGSCSFIRDMYQHQWGIFRDGRLPTRLLTQLLNNNVVLYL